MGTRNAVLIVCGVMVAAVAGGRSVTIDAGEAQPTPRNRLAEHFPNVLLRTQDNRDVRFYDDLVKGKVVLINFMFTTCTSLCPRSTANLVKVQELLGDHADRDVFLVSISVDPDHDTPAVLKRYAERYHARPGWTFVTGKREDVDLIRRGLGVRDNDDRSQHTGMLIYGNEAFGRWAPPDQLSWRRQEEPMRQSLRGARLSGDLP